MPTQGDSITLRIEKPAAGGRMIARHDGMVVLVAGAIPDELVRARVERVERSMALATVSEVLEAHPSRREVAFDPRCGGAVYAHIGIEHQRALKGEVVVDALRRLGRLPWETPVPVAASPEHGYRMRARLHVRDGHAGFFLEGTHQLCDGRASGQLLDQSWAAVDAVASELRHAGLSGDADLELSEDVGGQQRAIHIEFDSAARVRAGDVRLTTPDVTGLSWSVRGVPREQVVAGTPAVEDVLPLPGGSEAAGVRLRRHARAFFQGNRYLLHTLVDTVANACLDGPIVDLYAGVGLFGVSLAARGAARVDVVEGHHASARNLRENAAPYSEAITVIEAPVERYLSEARPLGEGTLVLDPPRTGMTRAAAEGAVRLGARRVVFVSCDVATFARDVRAFADAGYTIDALEAFDLFPNTAHVEVVARLTRR